MELMRTQQILARLYTDSELRKRFFAAPSAAAEALGIAENEILGLAPLSAEQLQVFATSLVRKRAREVSKLLPVTTRVLGGSFEPVFQSFAKTFQPGGIRKHCDDAIAFAQFLRQRARIGALVPSWIGDLSVYEAANLEATHSARRFTARFLQYAVAEAVAVAARRNSLPSVEPRPGIAIWFRLSRWRGVCHFTLLLPARSEPLTVLRLNGRPSGGARVQLCKAFSDSRPGSSERRLPA